MRVSSHFRPRSAFWLFALVAAVLMLGPLRANAQCSLGSAGAQAFNITLPATATIPRDAPVGTVLAQGSANFTFNSAAPSGVHCTSAATAVYANLIGGASTNGVMPTSLSGVGFTVQTNGTAINSGTVSLPATFFTTGCGNTTVCYGYLGGPITVALVKTGPITGTQVFPAGQVLSLTVGGIVAATVSVANPVQVMGQTCTVTTPSVSVSLGTVASKTFTSVGSSSTPTSFQIGLNCTGVTTNVGITFTDATNPGNATSTLSLTDDSSATGVGIQILYSGSPVQYGADSSVAGNAGQVMLGSINDTSQNLNFSGRYVQTGSAVTAGTADGIATFTMSYQ